jgi:hypothetical protein
MTDKRFHLLVKFLHFVDNSKFHPDQHHKKLYKIQPVIDHLKTMWNNRKDFPDFVKWARLQKGKTVAAFCKKQMIMKWKDKRDAILISTFHVDSVVDVTARKGIIQKTYVVLDYNKNIGGVDRNNGQLQSYKLARERLKKYYQKMFCCLLSSVCLNALIIYKKDGRISRLDFLLTLAENMSSLGGVVEPATRDCLSKSPKPSRLIGRCFPNTVHFYKLAKMDKKNQDRLNSHLVKDPVKRLIACSIPLR